MIESANGAASDVIDELWTDQYTNSQGLIFSLASQEPRKKIKTGLSKDTGWGVAGIGNLRSVCLSTTGRRPDFPGLGPAACAGPAVPRA